MTLHTYVSSAAVPPPILLLVSHNIPLHANNRGCGKKEVHIDWSMVRSAKAALVNGTKLPRGLLAQCRRTFGSERHRHEVTRPDKLGTDPMAYGGIYKWTSPRKLGGIPRVSTRFSLSVKNEQTDAGRDDQTCLARPNSQARTGTGKYSFSFFS